MLMLLLCLSFHMLDHPLFPSSLTFPFSLIHLFLIFAHELILASLLPFIFPAWLTERWRGVSFPCRSTMWIQEWVWKGW